MKHTPSPWGTECALSSDQYNIRYITGPNNEKVCNINHRVEMTQEEALANATLIIAAPELLAALLAIVEEAGDSYGFAEPDGAVIGTINRMAFHARAAIAKATVNI